jgi:uncharacterized protein
MRLIEIDGQQIPPGKVTQIDMPVAKLYTDIDVAMPIHITRSRRDGPVVFVCAAVHGDELNGIEIIRRLIRQKTMKLTKGTLIVVPMVNVYGVLNQSRYMPDRRDLNRSFPGSPSGSLAGRVAYKFLNEIVKICDYGIDLHTGAIHRSNLPQVRADLDDEETLALAKSFGVPVLINANLRDGSLRESAVENHTKILLYEAGQALRFDELSIRVGIRGIINVLMQLGMLKTRRKMQIYEPFIAYKSVWVRAGASGIVRDLKRLGDQVRRDEVISEIGDPFGGVLQKVCATRSGIVIGKQNIPLVQEGDAMFHIAYFREADDEVVETIEAMHEILLPGVQNLPPVI